MRLIGTGKPDVRPLHSADAHFLENTASPAPSRCVSLIANVKYDVPVTGSTITGIVSGQRPSLGPQDFEEGVADSDTGMPYADTSGPDFESIMRRHQAMVFSLAYHFLQDRGRAEEVAQDVFLSLYRNLDGMKSAAHTVFWLRKVTVQRSIDEARRSRRWFHKSLEDTAEPAAEPISTDPLREEQVWRMVARLPEVPRMVVILRYQEDLGPAEIAAALSLPVATVKSHLQRSLAVLREKLGGLLGTSQFGETV
jgi:RNA polymerase sigma-70 factor (ECF subfamily)